MMELDLAEKLKEMELDELEDIIRKLRFEDREAFDVLREIVEDHI